MSAGPNETASTKLVKRKRAFLDQLTEGFPLGHAYEVVGISKSTYYRWRSDDQQFKDEADLILADPKTRHRKRLKLAQGSVHPEDDWQEIFYLTYLSTGDRNEAANDAGVSALMIEDCLDQTSESFNQEFASLVHEIETRHLWAIEDAEKKRAKTDHRSAKFILSNLREQFRQSSPIAGGINITNNYWFTSQGESEAMKTLGSLFRKEKEITVGDGPQGLPATDA